MGSPATAPYREFLPTMGFLLDATEEAKAFLERIPSSFSSEAYYEHKYIKVFSLKANMKKYVNYTTCNKHPEGYRYYALSELIAFYNREVRRYNTTMITADSIVKLYKKPRKQKEPKELLGTAFKHKDTGDTLYTIIKVTAYTVVVTWYDGKIHKVSYEKGLVPRYFSDGHWILHNTSGISPEEHEILQKAFDPSTINSTNEPTKQKETPMNTNILHKYKDINFATPILFRGECIKGFTKEDYMSKLRLLDSEIRAYDDLKGTAAVDDIVSSIKVDRTKLASYFNEHMESLK